MEFLVLAFIMSIVVSLGFLASLRETIKINDPELFKGLYSQFMFWWVMSRLIDLAFKSITGWFQRNGCSENTVAASRLARYPVGITVALFLAMLVMWLRVAMAN